MKYVIVKLLRLKKTTNRFFNFIKFLFPKFLNVTSVFFLRKSNTFIKSKYTKNRQWSKSIVYFGLWFGVISAFLITYYTYRFLFIFSYVWWLPAIVVFAIATSYALKNFRYLTLSFLKIWF